MEVTKMFQAGDFEADTCKEIEAIAFHGAANCPWPLIEGTTAEELLIMPMGKVMDNIRFAVCDDFDYGCRIDEVVPLRDSVKLVDYKTKDSISNIGLSWYDKVLSMDLQQILYRTAYEKAHGTVVDEFEFRYIKRPAIRQKKGETHAEYIARIGTEYSQSCNIDKYYADCLASAHNAHKVLESFQMVLARMERRYNDGGWEMNPLSCISYNRACKYLPICYSEPGWKDLYDDKGEDYHPELESDDEKPERTTGGGTEEF
jgi:hypothetical protein